MEVSPKMQSTTSRRTKLSSSANNTYIDTSNTSIIREENDVYPNNTKKILINPVVFSRKNVLRLLEEYPVVRGPLDISTLLLNQQQQFHNMSSGRIINREDGHDNMNKRDSLLLPVLRDEELTEFIRYYQECEVLLMTKWTIISDMHLRCISLTMGASLLDLDLSGSHICAEQMEILFSRIFNLKSLRMSTCPRVNGNCFRVLARTCGKSLTLLYVDKCPLIKLDALLYMSGGIGLNAPRLGKLHILDLSECSLLEDRALVGLALGCKQLRHLSLRNDSLLGDAGICAVVQSNAKLELLNISGCVRVTDQVLHDLASRCRDLTSLNVSLCVQLHDAGVIILSKGCSRVQAINLAGIRNISEVALCALAVNCPGLLMLNVTGCDKIAASGSQALVLGLQFVEEGLSFVGIKPADKHIELKLANQLMMIHTPAAVTIQTCVKARKLKRETKAKYQYDRVNNAARILQRCIRSYGKRLWFHWMWRRRVENNSAVLIQRVYRGCVGRRRACKQRQICAEHLRLYPTVTLMQKVMRGHLARLHYPEVYDHIRVLYMRRYIESRAAIAVLIQRTVRRYMVFLRLGAYTEIIARGRLNKIHAATLVQQIIRRFLARCAYLRLLAKRREWECVRDISARALQKWLRALVVRLHAIRAREQRRLRRLLELASATRMQRYYRGFLARQRVHHMRIHEATRWFAATLIQKTFRASLVLHWRDIRLNAVAAFVLDRHAHERSLRVQDCRKRYSQFVKDNLRDSASEDEDEVNEVNGEAADWSGESGWAELRHRQTGATYWYNSLTNEKTYVAPASQLALDMSYVGLRVRVFWVVQGEWYEGSIVKFHRWKRKYRIDYDDGDHEWIRLDAEAGRVQIWHEGGWLMKQLYVPAEQQEEAAKAVYRRQEKDAKRTAFRDAMQWSVLQDDTSGATGLDGKLLYMSAVTGELRTGSADALLWEMQSDEMGYPLFCHRHTGAVSYEDPRFTHDVTEDLAAQREYVLQELRFACYFCSDLLAKYQECVEQGDQRLISRALRNIRHSEKPKQLSAFMLRAKLLFKQTSVTDKPIDANIQEELSQVAILIDTLTTLQSEATFIGIVQDQAKRDFLSDLSQKNRKTVYCHYCKHETQRHLEYCPTCGKKQLF